MRRNTLRLAALVIMTLGSLIQALDAPFLVEEPGVSARAGEGVSCGVPFVKGAVNSLSGLSLQGPSGEIPAQFDLLSRYGDGSIQWALASFVTDIAKSQTLNMAVRTTAPAAMPANAVTITRTGSILSFSNGALRFRVDTAAFTGIDSLYYKGTPVFGGKSGGIFLKNYITGATHSNSSTAVTAKLVYAGALRATLKVDGVFFRQDTGAIGFSYLITVYAGSPKLKIDIAVKNSINPACGDVARVERCWLSFPALFAPTAQVSYNYSADALLKPDVVNYAANGFSMTVHEDWGGGWYKYGTFQYHNQGITGGQLFVDVVTTPDSARRGTRAAYGYENGPWLWLPDGFHKNSQIFLDFSDAALTQSQVTTRYNENKSLLFGRSDPEYLSSTGAYGIHNRFGTFEDEKKMWTRFGGDTSGSSLTFPNRNLNFMITLPGYAGVHADFEEDPLETYLLMWLRTGKRGFLDVGEGWSKYMKAHFTVHTDGFAYDGWRNVIGTLRSISSRAYVGRAGDPQFLSGNGNLIFHSTADILILAGGGSSYAGCHVAGQGLVDWYCLTGDPLALAAADDLAEIVWLHGWRYTTGTLANPQTPFTWTPAMTGQSFINVTREFTRHFKLLSHYVNRLHPSPDSLWFQRLRYVGSVYNRPTNRDPRGFLFMWYDSSRYEFINWPQGLTDYVAANNIKFKDAVRLQNLGYYEGRTTYNYALTIAMKPLPGGTDTLKWPIRKDDTYWSNRMNAPLENYVGLTGDEDARDLLIGYAQFCTYRNMMLDRCGFTHYSFYDFPDIDTGTNNSGHANFDPAHDVCQTQWKTTPGSMLDHSSGYGPYFPEVMMIGYHHTGDMNMMRKAFDVWNRNLKRGTWDGTYIMDHYDLPKMTAKYAFLKPNDWATLCDRLTGGLYLFREGARYSDTLPPAAVSDLYVSHEPGQPNQVRVSFTAPAEQGGGQVAEYQLKYDTVPVVEYGDFKFSRDYIFPCKGVTKSPWWYARNVKGETAPVAAGTKVEFLISDSAFAASDTFYLALCSRDTLSNLSRLSNVLMLTPSMVASESAFRAKTGVTLSARPNPFNPSTRFAVSFLPGAQPRLSVYDASGRLIRDLTSKIRKDQPNRVQQVAWDGKDAQGEALASGIYFAQFRSGSVVKKIRVSLVK